MTIHRSTFRARYAETDAMGVVHHAAYLPWLEVGRVDLLRAAGVPYTSIEVRGFLIVLSDIQVRYRSPARFDNLVTVETQLILLKTRHLSFGYRVLLESTGTLCVEARTDHIVVSRTSMRASQLPSDLLAVLSPWVSGAN
jgi:acyl-CoA thioester hydrolase